MNSGMVVDLYWADRLVFLSGLGWTMLTNKLQTGDVCHCLLLCC